MPIPGTRSPKRIEENAGAADVTLTEADLTAIDEILLPRRLRRPLRRGARADLDLTLPRTTVVRITPADGDRCVGWSPSCP